MAQVSVRCPGCKATLKVDGARAAGKTLKCPKCEKGFKVPARDGTQSSGGAKRGAKSGTPKRRRVAAGSPAGDEFDDGLFDSFETELGSFGQRPLPPARRRKRKASTKRAAASEEGVEPVTSPTKKKPALIVGGSLLGFVVLAGLAFAFGGAFHPSGSGQATVEVPQQFDSYRNEDGMFGCEYPSGWKVSDGGGTGGVPAWARFEKGDVTISIRHSSTGASVGDISGATNQMGGAQQEVPDELDPVAKVHEFRKSHARANMDNYEETAPEVIETGMGEGRLSEFTATTMFFGKIYGYRATLLSTRLQLNVFCKCYSEADWKALQPTFRKVIQSIQ